MVLSNYTNMVRQDPSGKRSHIYSATGVYSVVQDAIYASERIPESMTAEVAIHDFCFLFLKTWEMELSAPTGSLAIK